MVNAKYGWRSDLLFLLLRTAALEALIVEASEKSTPVHVFDDATLKALEQLSLLAAALARVCLCTLLGH
jgi:hypothetical protein